MLKRISDCVGVNGAGALNRILGLLILAIGVALVAQGVKSMLVPS
jgi:small neutral amino acid transporter SnatA (MarC family)